MKKDRFGRPTARLTWEWMNYWDLLIDLLDEYQTKCSWFAQCDLGPTYDSTFERCESILRELKKKGHEVSIHPHLYAWDDLRACWYQTTNPCSEQAIIKGCVNYARQYDLLSDTVHMGWNHLCGSCARALLESGIFIDRSALPGKFSDGAAYARPKNIYDWRSAPYGCHRYTISTQTSDNKDLSDLVEIPNIMTEIGGNVGAFGTKNFDNSLETTCSMIADEARDYYFATYSHPAEILNLEDGSLYWPALDRWRNSLEFIERKKKEGFRIILSPDHFSSARVSLGKGVLVSNE